MRAHWCASCADVHIASLVLRAGVGSIVEVIERRRIRVDCVVLNPAPAT
jgi:hypothetical protein